jgi:hypothetical protein
MKTKIMVLVMAITLVGMIFLAGGCKKEEPKTALDAAKSAVNETLCAKCGQVKGSDVCCKADAVKCTKCGKDKGSPGCCK